MRATSRAEIKLILSDPSYDVPAVAPGRDGLAWLRSTASRFVNGDEHARRRALVGAELAALDPAALRRKARSRTEAALSEATGRIDAMAAVARPVPLATLASALGVGDQELDRTVADARIVGPAYLSGDGDAVVDAAVERLRAALARDSPEGSAAAVAVLAQACEATAALIGNAFVLAAGHPKLRSAVNALLDEALRRSPPVRIMRRVSPRGERVLLDLDAAAGDARPCDRPLAFGSGIRPCPGELHALAIAAGVLEPLLRRRQMVSGSVSVAANAGLRMPERLEVIVR